MWGSLDHNIVAGSLAERFFNGKTERNRGAQKIFRKRVLQKATTTGTVWRAAVIAEQWGYLERDNES